MSDPQLSRLSSSSEASALICRVLKAKAKPEDMEAFRKLLDRYPGVVDTILNLTDQTFDAVFKPLAGDSAGALELLRRVRYMKQVELGYNTASPLEKLLIEGVVLSWIIYTNTVRRASSTWSESHSPALGDYWDKRVSAAQRRYLRAIETLARIRRLGLPAVQINIGARQVNQVNALPSSNAFEG